MNLKLITLSLLLLPLVLAGCGEEDGIPWGSGLIEANASLVSAEAGGRLQAINFDEGHHVTRGDTIVLIDTTVSALQLRQARAVSEVAQSQLRLAEIDLERAREQQSFAKKELDRIEKLLPSGSATQHQYDVAENQYDLAGLAVDQAAAALSSADAEIARIDTEIDLLEEQLRDCFPTAPTAGTVIEKFVDIGELAAPGKALIEIARLDTVWVKVYLPPNDLTRIKLGDSAEVDPEDGRHEPLLGEVTWIASEAEFTPKNVQTKEARADLVYAVKVTIPNPDSILKIGMPVMVRIR
jgi:HlyD family secretion protein